MFALQFKRRIWTIQTWLPPHQQLDVTWLCWLLHNVLCRFRVRFVKDRTRLTSNTGSIAAVNTFLRLTTIVGFALCALPSKPSAWNSLNCVLVRFITKRTNYNRSQKRDEAAEGKQRMRLQRSAAHAKKTRACERLLHAFNRHVKRWPAESKNESGKTRFYDAAQVE